MKKYWTLFKIVMGRNMVYRADFVFYTLVDVARFLVFPLIWIYVYQSSGQIAGYTLRDLISYYAIMIFIGSSVVSYMSNKIRNHIIKGELNQFLSKPINYSLYMTTKDLSYVIVSFFFGLTLLFVASFIFPNYIAIPHNPFTWLIFLFALSWSFIVSILRELLIGFSAFWLGETQALRNFVWILEAFFSGQLAPLAFYPLIFRQIADYLPFKYLFFFQAQIFLGKISPADMIRGFLFLFLWTLFFLSMVILIWRRGVKKFDGSGM
jgi:ABC-2 type transport system permease protein